MLTGWKERALALKVLLGFERDGKLKEHLERELSPLPPRERAFVRELSSGTVRYLKLLDFCVERATGKSLRNQKAIVRNALRLIAYQLLFTGVPPYAAVNETVEAVKRLLNRKAAGFVNAVSKRLVGFDCRGEVEKVEDFLQRLSILYSFPLWLVKRWDSFYGREELVPLLEALNRVPPLYLRVNRLKSSPKEFTELLTRKGYEWELHQFVPDMVRVKGRVVIQELPGYREGLFYIQDPASYLAALLVEPRPGELVLELGAAPGGKTTALAALMENRGKVVAVDVSKERVELLKRNLDWLGVKCVEPLVTDVLKDEAFIKKYYRSFDRILIDAPCSATGVIRRHPEGKWNKSLSLIKHNQEVQRGLLKAAKELLKEGGALLYSVCSLEREEGEDNFSFALEELGYRELPIEWPNLPKEQQGRGTLRVFPHKNDTDGFFYMKLTTG